MIKSKNILYVGGFELPDKNAAAQRVISNGKLLNQLGNNISYIGIDKSIEKSDEQLSDCHLDDFKYTYKKLSYPRTLLNWLVYLFSLKSIKNHYKNDLNCNLDIIIAYNYPSILLIRLKWFCKKRNIKLIGDITEWYEANGNFFYRQVKNLDTHLRMKYINKSLSGIIAISKFLYEFYSDTNVLLLPPLVDKQSKKWTHSDSISNNRCELIYIGIPNLQKDRLDLVIDALSRIKEKVRPFHFTIVGSDKSTYLNAYQLNDVHENLKENLTFLGKKPHNEVLELVKKSDYSIFLRTENIVNKAGFPTKFAESISCTVPVLTNLSSNITDFLIDGWNGFILDTEENSILDVKLTSAINKNNDEINLLKSNCAKDDHFDYRTYLQPMNEFLNKL